VVPLWYRSAAGASTVLQQAQGPNPHPRVRQRAARPCITARSTIRRLPFTIGGAFAKAGPDVGWQGDPGYPQVSRIDRARPREAGPRARSRRTWPGESRPPRTQAESVAGSSREPAAAGPIHGLPQDAQAEAEGPRQDAKGDAGRPFGDQSGEEAGTITAVEAAAQRTVTRPPGVRATLAPTRFRQSRGPAQCRPPD